MTACEYGHEFTLPGPFRGMSEIQAANEAAGFHFFEPATLRFFDSRLGSPIVGRLFVTSEQFHGSDGVDGPRLYTLRVAHNDGKVCTVGEFQQYATSTEALRAARELLSPMRRT